MSNLINPQPISSLNLPVPKQPPFLKKGVRDTFVVPRSTQTLMQGFNLLAHLAPNAMAEVAYRLLARPRRAKKSYLNRLPDGARPFSFPFRTQKLNGFRWGESGPKVILLHGWESHLGRMLPLVNPLREAGYQVIALDGPAHGRSGHRSTNVFDFGEALKALLIREAGAEAILAHSFGAAATMLMLANNRYLQPEKLVCFAPMANMRIHLSIFQSLSGVTNRTMRLIETKLKQRFGGDGAIWDVTNFAHRLSCRGMVIHDKDDPIVPFDLGASLAAGWPMAELMMTNGLGHNRILKDPLTIGRTIDFLRGL